LKWEATFKLTWIIGSAIEWVASFARVMVAMVGACSTMRLFIVLTWLLWAVLGVRGRPKIAMLLSPGISISSQINQHRLRAWKQKKNRVIPFYECSRYMKFRGGSLCFQTPNSKPALVPTFFLLG
jgi:hypothetical protein